MSANGDVGITSVLRRYYVGITSVLRRYYVGITSVLRRYYVGITSVLRRYYVGITSVLRRYYVGITSVLRRYYVGITSVLRRYYVGITSCPRYAPRAPRPTGGAAIQLAVGFRDDARSVVPEAKTAGSVEHSFAAGDMVEVVEGDLRHLQGKVLRFDGNKITMMPKHETLTVGGATGGGDGGGVVRFRGRRSEAESDAESSTKLFNIINIF